MFDPKFDDDFALYIIWARPASGRMHTLAAGGLRAMLAAWEVVQEDCPTEELTLQHRSRVLHARPPLIKG
jgi:hypothetical protein